MEFSRHQLDQLQREIVDSMDLFCCDIRVGGVDDQVHSAVCQHLQLLAGRVVRSVADDEHGRQLTGVGKIDDILAVADKACFIVVAGDLDAVVDHQFAVSNQYPFAVHPGGQSHRILVGHIFDRTEHRAVGADDFIENIGEHSVGVAHHAGSVQDDRVDLALVKRFDTVQDDVRRTEEVLGIQHDRLGAGEGIHRRVAGYHCACRNQLGGHPVQRQIGGDGRGQRRADTHDGGEGGNGLGNVLVEQVGQHRKDDACQQADRSQDAAHVFGVVLGVGVVQKVGEERAGFRVCDGVFLHRKPAGDFSQQVAVF